VPKLWQEITATRCVITQKRAFLSFCTCVHTGLTSSLTDDFILPLKPHNIYFCFEPGRLDKTCALIWAEFSL
jgi:hypothetical protein